MGRPFPRAAMNRIKPGGAGELVPPSNGGVMFICSGCRRFLDATSH